jgi:hypothetical protein
MASVCAVLVVVTSALASTSHVWGSGTGIGAWTGTAEGMESPSVTIWSGIAARVPPLLVAVSSLAAAALVARRR